MTFPTLLFLDLPCNILVESSSQIYIGGRHFKYSNFQNSIVFYFIFWLLWTRVWIDSLSIQSILNINRNSSLSTNDRSNKIIQFVISWEITTFSCQQFSNMNLEENPSPEFNKLRPPTLHRTYHAFPPLWCRFSSSDGEGERNPGETWYPTIHRVCITTCRRGTRHIYVDVSQIRHRIAPRHSQKGHKAWYSAIQWIVHTTGTPSYHENKTVQWETVGMHITGYIT